MLQTTYLRKLQEISAQLNADIFHHYSEEKKLLRKVIELDEMEYQ